MRWLATVVMIGMLAGCADMSGVYVSQKNPPEFRAAMTAGTLTERELESYIASGTVNGRRQNQSTVMIAGTPVRSSTWIVGNYPDRSKNTWVVFVDGKFSSSVEMNSW